jgi:maltose O-acetyltransferase
MFAPLLTWLDKFIYSKLTAWHDIMPTRFAKYLALYYPDARLRKLYSSYIGVSMGHNTYANFGLKVVPNDNKICVHIGNNVSIAPNVLFICCSSPNNARELAKIDYVSNKLIQSSDIYIEDEAWIGANVTMFPGVSVGKCSVIGAGSIVMNNVESYSIYAGIPAKKIRDLRTGKRVDLYLNSDQYGRHEK